MRLQLLQHNNSTFSRTSIITISYKFTQSHSNYYNHAVYRLLQSFTNTLQEVTLVSLPEHMHSQRHPGKSVQLHSFTDNTKRV